MTRKNWCDVAALAALASLPMWGGCGDDAGAMGPDNEEGPLGTEDGTGSDASEPPGTATGESQRAEVQWKRYAAFEADLTRALGLTSDELCQEFGVKNCIREVHLVSLGGNNAIDHGLLVPSAEPTATTPAVVDRVVLSGCSKRVALDREAGPEGALVFAGLDLNTATPPPTDSSVRDTIVTLYRRLLSRDPLEDEVDKLAVLATTESGEAVSGADFAALACYVVGTSSEFLFF